jgi:hypothetical protein
MSSEIEDQKSRNDEKKSLAISAKKYSTLAEFQDDFYLEKKAKKKTEEEIKKQEEEAQEKEKEEEIKQSVLSHWSKLLVKEPPKRRTCHVSFIHDSFFYVIGGIDITEQKQDDIYKINLNEPKATWTKLDTLGEKIGRIAYHAGAELNGYYYIVGGQDESLRTLSSIYIFDITQERISEKIEQIELENAIEMTDVKKLELLKKFLQILRSKIKDKIESDKINIFETEIEKELLNYLDKDELIKREKDILESLEKDLPTADINKITDSSINLETIDTETIGTTFSEDFLKNAQEKMDEKLKLYLPPLESHTVNANEEQTLLIIYGGMTGKEYNRHVFTFDPQSKKAKNLTEKLEIENMPPPRQDHAAVIYKNCLYVYCGIGPDSKIYDDMWKFDLSSNTWEELKTDAQRNKEEKRKKRIEEKQANNEEIETEDEDLEDEEEDENNKDIRPKGRSGHSMVLVGDLFYIFGGKTGLIKESNEIWEYNPIDNIYTCVHETLLEQFTKEELQKISLENKRDVKKFRWLTRSDIEKRTNPSFNDNKAENDAEKEKKKLKDRKKKKENDKNAKDDKKDNKQADKNRNRNIKKTEKTDTKSGQNKELEGKYSAQILCRPNVVKMRKTLIFTSDPEKIKEGLNTLSKDEKEKINANIESIKGEVPEPRDGQSVCVEGTKLYIFGGDRFKFPFNDLFVLETNQIPKLKIKESKRKKIEKEKEREEKEREQREREEKEREEREGEEKQKKLLEEKANEDNEDKIKEEEKEEEDQNKNEDDQNRNEEDQNKNEEENAEKKEGENEEKKEEEEKKEKEEEKKVEEEDRLLREILQY